ncbi:cellulase-domain-containing protein, partial [Piromyces finnis]
MRPYATFAAFFPFLIGGIHAMRDISSKDLVKELKFGWNLGNTLEATCYDSMDYSKDQTASETCWENVKTTAQLYKTLSENGYNVFRIPVTWTGHFGVGPDYIINEKWMKRVHEVVDYAINTGAYAIIDVHHENWNYAFNDNLERAKKIEKALWTQIAQEFADYDEHLIFECLNEPRKVGSELEWTGGDDESWNFINELNAVCINAIRSSSGNNPLRHIMIPTYAASFNDTSIEHLNLHREDNKIIVSLHSYTPYHFALDQSEMAYSVYNDTTEIEIDYVLNGIYSSLVSKNVPVIIGEFGTVNRNNYESRVKWARYYVKRAKAKGLPCILWDNGKFEGKGELFGHIDRSTYEFKFPYIQYGYRCGLGSMKYCQLVQEMNNPKNNTIEDDNKNNESEKTTTTTTTINPTSNAPTATTTTTITPTSTPDTNNTQNNSTSPSDSNDESTSSIDYHYAIHMIKNIKFIYLTYLIAFILINYY